MCAFQRSMERKGGECIANQDGMEHTLDIRHRQKSQPICGVLLPAGRAQTSGVEPAVRSCRDPASGATIRRACRRRRSG
jgi:hypothetical protein